MFYVGTCKSSYLVVTTEDPVLSFTFIFKQMHNDKPLYTNPGGNIFLFFRSDTSRWVVDSDTDSAGMIYTASTSFCPPSSGWEYADNREVKPSVQASCAPIFSIATSEDLSSTHDWWTDLTAQYSFRKMFNGRCVSIIMHDRTFNIFQFLGLYSPMVTCICSTMTQAPCGWLTGPPTSTMMVCQA